MRKIRPLEIRVQGKSWPTKEARQDKISANNLLIHLNDIVNDKSISNETGHSQTGDSVSNNSKTQSPVGRLRKAQSKWREIGTNSFIMGVITEGYKLPFISCPDNSESKNNCSAR